MQRARLRILARVLLAKYSSCGGHHWRFGRCSLVAHTSTARAQLILKPLRPAHLAHGLPLLMIGLLAALGSGLLLDRHARTADQVRIST